jgi:hypothetical protein
MSHLQTLCAGVDRAQYQNITPLNIAANHFAAYLKPFLKAVSDIIQTPG